MRCASTVSLLFALACAAGAGCHHDLALLRGPIDAADGGGGSGKPEPDPVPDAGNDTKLTCSPCDAPPGFLDLGNTEACCTGLRNAQCGVLLASTSRCLVRDVPSVPEPTCPEVMRFGVKLPGCCRFDGQCGLTIDALDLACIGRDEVPALLGGPLAPRACAPKCDSDQTCSARFDLSICVEDASHRADSRYCALSCKSDKDCSLAPDTVCAIQANTTEGRFDAICRKPIGPGAVGAKCENANGCASGVCLEGTPAYCSQLCRTDLDCPGVGSQCKMSGLQLFDPAAGKQPFNICTLRR